MIAKLRGRLDSVAEEGLVVDVGGVGYFVHCASRLRDRLPALGEPVSLLIETQLREDSITLYGFLDAAEREWFRLLQTVQGVGARLALAIIGTLGAEELARAVAAQDRATLGRANGVGPRLATRIATELRDRAPAAALSLVPVGGQGANGPGTLAGGAVQDAV
jgi:Holliday junction DNA helicase RuvA